MLRMLPSNNASDSATGLAHHARSLADRERGIAMPPASQSPLPVPAKRVKPDEGRAAQLTHTQFNSHIKENEGQLSAGVSSVSNVIQPAHNDGTDTQQESTPPEAQYRRKRTSRSLSVALGGAAVTKVPTGKISQAPGLFA